MSKLVLYDSHGVARVRSVRVGVDAPAVGAWTPDNLNADEIAAPLTAGEVTLRGYDWQDVRLVARFAGAIGGAESIEIEPLIAVPDPVDPSTRVWAALSKVTLAPHLDTADVPVRGHDIAFRITDLNLDASTSVSLDATGGQHKAE